MTITTSFPGFTGNNCETKIDLCEGWLCLNNGTCIVHRNVPVCHCQPRFSGEHCEIDISVSEQPKNKKAAHEGFEIP